MQESLAPRLACPACRARLTLRAEARFGDGAVETGTLSCSACGREHAVTRGIPRLAAAADDGSARTASRFGWQWRSLRYVGGINFWASRELFLEYLSPVEAGFLRGKTVLDAGCGLGRFARHALEAGAAEVFAVDLSDSVEAVRLQCAAAPPNLHVVQADLAALPIDGAFDYAYCLGVLHHMPDPAAGFASLARAVKPGGHLSIWVYGRENNDWIVNLVDPVRRGVTSRLPISVVCALSYALAAVLYPTIGHLGRVSSFYNEYVVNMLSRLTFRELAGVILDHLQTPTSFYVSRAEVERWFADNGVELLSISARNANSWRAFGRRP